MKITNILTLLVLSLIFIHCGEEKMTDNQVVIHHQNDNAIDDIDNNPDLSSKISSYKRHPNNLVDKIYESLLKKDSVLQKLDKKIANIHENTDKTIASYQKILSKSENYYTDAHLKTKMINDSIFAIKIDSLLIKSEKIYQQKTNDIRNKIKEVENNDLKINDLYSAFKIKKTLLEIEKYQNSKEFDFKNINELINKQTKILEKLNKI